MNKDHEKFPILRHQIRIYGGDVNCLQNKTTAFDFDDSVVGKFVESHCIARDVVGYGVNLVTQVSIMSVEDMRWLFADTD